MFSSEVDNEKKKDPPEQNSRKRCFISVSPRRRIKKSNNEVKRGFQAIKKANSRGPFQKASSSAHKSGWGCCLGALEYLAVGRAMLLRGREVAPLLLAAADEYLSLEEASEGLGRERRVVDVDVGCCGRLSWGDDALLLIEPAVVAGEAAPDWERGEGRVKVEER